MCWQTVTGLKGQCHDIQWFFALFLREQKNGGCSRKCRGHQTWAVRAAWQPGHFRWLLTWQCREPTTSRAGVALLHLSTATGSTFVFRLGGPSKVISPSSRFKISSDSYRYRFFILVFGSARLPKLASAISSPTAWVTGRRNRQCGCSFLSSDFDDVCHCEGKCAERGTSSRNGWCRRSCRHRPLLWYSHSTWQRLEDSRNALVVSCGDVQVGDRGRSKETLCMSSVQLFSVRRCTFEHCTSRCCPSRDATMVALTEKRKKKAERRLPLHEKDLLRVGANVGSEMFSQVRSLAADRVHSPVS